MPTSIRQFVEEIFSVCTVAFPHSSHTLHCYPPHSTKIGGYQKKMAGRTWDLCLYPAKWRVARRILAHTVVQTKWQLNVGSFPLLLWSMSGPHALFLPLHDGWWLIWRPLWGCPGRRRRVRRGRSLGCPPAPLPRCWPLARRAGRGSCDGGAATWPSD